MNFDQGQFDFDSPGSEAGWKRWREQLDQQKQAFESRWGVRLGKVVTVTLINHTKPITGCLEWLNRSQPSSKSQPRFRIGSLEFEHKEIESIVEGG